MTDNKSDLALQERLQFIGLDSPAQEALRSIRGSVAADLGPALDIFYEKVRSTPQMAKQFSNDAHVNAAKGLQGSHWERIASAQFDTHYLASAQRIGEAHANRGIEPRWYIGGYANVLPHLVGSMIVREWPKLSIGGRGKAEQLAAAVGALVKATLLDMDISISVYLEQLNKRAETATAAQDITQKEQQLALGILAEAVSRLAAGNLVEGITKPLPPAFGDIGIGYNEAIEALSSAVGSVTTAVSSIESTAKEIAVASDDLSQRTEQQAASLEETSAALEQITATVHRTSTSTLEANGIVSSAKAEAETSAAVVQRAIDAMSLIEQSSSQISSIIGVIDEIAFQTNLLALNAGVEAARAGEAGRGFAVVASEVRALAQRSAEAAKEIKSLISASTKQVDDGVKLVAETGEALGRILEQVSSVDKVVSEIAAGAKEQSAGLDEVATAVNQMDQVTQQNAAMVEQTTAASHSLRSEMQDLLDAVQRFKTKDGVAAAASTPARSAPPPAVRPAMPARAPARTTPRTLGATALARPKSAPVDDEGWTEF